MRNLVSIGAIVTWLLSTAAGVYPAFINSIAELSTFRFRLRSIALLAARIAESEQGAFVGDELDRPFETAIRDRHVEQRRELVGDHLIAQKIDRIDAVGGRGRGEAASR